MPVAQQNRDTFVQAAAVTPDALTAFDAYADLLARWQARINLVGSQTLETLWHRHFLDSAQLFTHLPPDTQTLTDIGSGGGFPGLPLAVMPPDTTFVLCDSIGKKIKVVQAAAKAAELNNVTALHARAEDVDGSYDFVVSRAVTRMAGFLSWLDGKIKTDSAHPLANGVLYLKGGDLTEELSDVEASCQVTPLATWFADPFFETKQVVHVDLSTA